MEDVARATHFKMVNQDNVIQMQMKIRKALVVPVEDGVEILKLIVTVSHVRAMQIFSGDLMEDVAEITHFTMVNQDSVIQMETKIRKGLVARIEDGVEILMLIATVSHV